MYQDSFRIPLTKQLCGLHGLFFLKLVFRFGFLALSLLACLVLAYIAFDIKIVKETTTTATATTTTTTTTTKTLWFCNEMKQQNWHEFSLFIFILHGYR
jgi:hypothetical protein